MNSIALVFVGGGSGSVLRYLIGLGFVSSRFSLPWSTLISNVMACLIFAGLSWWTQNKVSLQESTRHLMLTGFCGGLSTFSAFSNETFLLFRQGMAVYALGNVFLSLALCLSIFFWFNR